MADETNGPADQPNAAPSVEELMSKLNTLEKRYQDSSAEGKRLAQQNQQLFEALNQRPSIPQRDTDPFAKLQEYGVPADDLRMAISQAAEQIVDRRFAPLVQGMDARGKMLARHGEDYNKFEPQVFRFLQENPEINAEYNDIFTGKPNAAASLDYAFMKFTEAKRRASKNGKARDNSSEEASHAAIPSSRGGEGRRPETSDSDMLEARRRYQESPNQRTAEAYAKARFKKAVTDEFLNQ